MTDNLIRASEERAKSAQDRSTFGMTIVEAGHKLAGYVGRVLGTVPEDAAGLVIGDPLCFVRSAIASQYDNLLTKLLAERGVREPEPVTPALAIPLLRAAYDESRPELQDLWGRLLAAAMDPSRAGNVRQSFIDAIRQLDPLDARLLVWMSSYSGPDIVNLADRACKELNASHDEIQISFVNLAKVGCVSHDAQRRQQPGLVPFGRKLLSACYD
ncbi:MAG TPA: Abi-alpha family protein [Stellaceae bacterium]|nr:Abi-alpha family protein [Stellaceae bacterium]